MGLFNCCSSSLAVVESAHSNGAATASDSVVKPPPRDAPNKERSRMPKDPLAEILDLTATLEEEEHDLLTAQAATKAALDWTTLLGNRLLLQGGRECVSTRAALGEAQMVLLYDNDTTDMELVHKLTVFGAGFDRSVAIVYLHDSDDINMPARWFQVEDVRSVTHPLLKKDSTAPRLIVLDAQGNTLCENALSDIAKLDVYDDDYDSQALHVMLEWTQNDFDYEVIGDMEIPMQQLEAQRLQHEIQKTDQQIHAAKRAMFDKPTSSSPPSPSPQRNISSKQQQPASSNKDAENVMQEQQQDDSNDNKENQQQDKEPGETVTMLLDSLVLEQAEMNGDDDQDKENEADDDDDIKEEEDDNDKDKEEEEKDDKKEADNVKEEEDEVEEMVDSKALDLMSEPELDKQQSMEDDDD